MCHCKPLSVQSKPSHYISFRSVSVIQPRRLRSSKWPPSFTYSHPNSICITLLHHTCYIFLLSHLPWFDNLNILFDEKLHFSPAFFLICLTPKNCPQPLLSNTASLHSSSSITEQFRGPYWKTDTIHKFLQFLTYRFRWPHTTQWENRNRAVLLSSSTTYR